MLQCSCLGRLFAARAPRSEGRFARSNISNTVLSCALALAAAACLLDGGRAYAQQGEIVDGVGTPTNLGGTDGMPASNPRIADILAAHPSQFTVICVAGCDGKAKVVQTLPKPVVTRSGENVPSSANMNGSLYGPPAPGASQASTADDVVCLAGCATRPGEVLQRFADLPAGKQRTPQKPEAEPKKAKPDKSDDESIWDDLIP